MSSTNYTPNLNLSQFIGTDKPTWLGDYNSDMYKIDTAVHNLEIGTSSVIAGQIELLQNSVEELTRQDADFNVKIAANTSSIADMAVRLETAESDIESLDTREADHFKTLSAEGGAQQDTIKDIQEKLNYVERNTNKVESMAVINTASIAKLQVRVSAAESDISQLQNESNDYSADIDNLKKEVDTIDTTVRQQNVQIANIQKKNTEQDSSIAQLDTDVSSLETSLQNHINTATYDISNLQSTVEEHTSAITTLESDVSALERKTDNITDGVTVPFGFGTTADDKRGYQKSDGTIEPFATASDISELQNDVDDNMTDISELQAKTANITDGKALPFSLGIESAGGAYGYIPNGESGVVPFLSSDDVKQIVNLQPIEAKLANVDGAPKITEVGNRAYLNDSVTAYRTNESPSGTIVLDSRSGGNSVSFGSGSLKFPFGFGIDSNGNYGYIKAGADTVTPFLNRVNTEIGKIYSTTNLIVTSTLLPAYVDNDIYHFYPSGPMSGYGYDYIVYYLASDGTLAHTDTIKTNSNKYFEYIVNSEESSQVLYVICCSNGPNRRVPCIAVETTRNEVYAI